LKDFNDHFLFLIATFAGTTGVLVCYFFAYPLLFFCHFFAVSMPILCCFSAISLLFLCLSFAVSLPIIWSYSNQIATKDQIDSNAIA